jgi:hypothetical protein
MRTAIASAASSVVFTVEIPPGVFPGPAESA